MLRSFFIFISAHFVINKKLHSPIFFNVTADWGILLVVKWIRWDCKGCQTQTSNKSGTMDRNPETLVQVAPKAERLEERQVRLESGRGRLQRGAREDNNVHVLFRLWGLFD